MIEQLNEYGNRVCMNPGCEGEYFCRGLCKACYCVADRLVRDKRKTWDELIETGRALKPWHRTSQRMQWMMGGN